MKKNSWVTVAQFYGEFPQLIKTCEELAELASAFLSHDISAIVEEAADVLAMDEQVCYLLDPDHTLYINNIDYSSLVPSEIPSVCTNAIILIAKSLNYDGPHRFEFEILEAMTRIRLLIDLWAGANR